MSDDEAYAAFRTVRFADNGGQPTCPKPECQCAPAYEFKSRRLFKCKRCERQFSITSGTIFANRKLSHRDILIAIALFVNGANGYPALRFSRDLNVSYKAAWVLLHKLRVVMGTIQEGVPLTGEVEIDGVWLGGKIRKLNLVVDREKLAKEKKKAKRDAIAKGAFFSPDTDPEKELCIVTFRERRRGGRSRSYVFKRESMAIGAFETTVDAKAKLITDAGTHWGQLGLHYDRQEVSHSVGFVVNGVHINGVESSHSRIRRGQRGVYLRLSGHRLQNYADEFSWRDSHRRLSNGQQFQTVLAAAAKRPSVREWVGHWQKRKRPVDLAA